LGLCASAQATTWDLANDFSATSNPYGAWTYGYEQTFNGSLIKYTNPAWNDPTNNVLGTPALWKNTGSTTGLDLARVNARIRTRIAAGTDNLGDANHAIDVAASIASQVPRR
jgi:hypothetical protein